MTHRRAPPRGDRTPPHAPPPPPQPSGSQAHACVIAHARVFPAGASRRHAHCARSHACATVHRPVTRVCNCAPARHTRVRLHRGRCPQSTRVPLHTRSSATRSHGCGSPSACSVRIHTRVCTLTGKSNRTPASGACTRVYCCTPACGTYVCNHNTLTYVAVHTRLSHVRVTLLSNLWHTHAHTYVLSHTSHM